MDYKLFDSFVMSDKRSNNIYLRYINILFVSKFNVLSQQKCGVSRGVVGVFTIPKRVTCRETLNKKRYKLVFDKLPSN